MATNPTPLLILILKVVHFTSLVSKTSNGTAFMMYYLKVQTDKLTPP